MKPEYASWIATYNDDKESVRGLCSSATAQMVEAFPELLRVSGWVSRAEYAHFFDDGPGDFESGHWWCVTPDGAIVDPTVRQFGENRTDLVYIAYDEKKHGPMPVGKCPNCGFLIYPKDNCGGVHAECAEEFKRYLMNEGAW